LLKASYLGNNTIHLWTGQEMNPAVYVPGTCAAGQYGLTAAGPCSTISNTQARRLLTQLNPAQGKYFGALAYLDDGGTASYNGLLLSAEHRLSNHFSMLANYTYAHCIGDPQTTELAGPTYVNPADRRLDRGNCLAVDVRHNFNLSAVLQSPSYSSRPLRWIAGGWQLAPIVGLRTGSFFSITSGVDSALTGIGSQRPLQVLPDPYCANRSYTCWLNRNAFSGPSVPSAAAPTPYYGSIGVNSLVGPGYFDLDLALSRRFSIREKQYVEIRAESFNLENRVNFLNPSNPGLVGNASGAALNSSNFGKILSDVSPRIMQFALKYVF
jgi:hypothetical protein